MTQDPDFADDYEVGEWLHAKLMAAFPRESEAWAINRARAVESELQFRRFPRPRLHVEILWLDQMTAFTAPGRYVYITRELLQLCPSDDAAALAVAHEIGHHDLGHLELFAGRLAPLRGLPAGPALAAALRVVDRLTLGPEHELAADRYALELCLKAGYDGRQCLELLDHLETHLLNYHDIDGVFGPQTGTEATLAGIGHWIAQAKQWNWEHLRGYPPLRDRREALERQLREHEVPSVAVTIR